MFEDYQICPYTGLRSFTEEESLYFKGREDDIDQATVQLQKNKFLMLTGASGDGKSSLIYAGIIPNARAGFLKSKYTQWCIADFRPERTPFQNLCSSLAKQLDISNPYTVQSELNHGFSALVDLYRNSKRFIDTRSISWQQADDQGKAAMKRDAANLIILVDQFEEFFTNPENYQHGVPSRDANLVLNLLLETARIALEDDLPIYVVFTMRSDYIGQCAAFRGLPEYLGFSQFFVPRLNRSQLQQVIEEPAKLSGNKISRRLTERLIHDITEGVDQLPILQHALNQIWVAATQGKEEMDLIHYAMVGGMSVHELPEEQAPRFNQWFITLPPEIKACYHAPNLQNVLDTHTNKLYEQAASYYFEKTGKNISGNDAKTIIRKSFTCLTKIDQSRAVRNRMTLQEITNIIGNPAFDTRLVGTVLNIFREPGNTFIHPFIIDEIPESQNLQAGQILDITHESLIRNWQYLGQWAREEYDSRSVSLDFEQQLGRWVNSGKSASYLLSIGPLTYFEGWYNKTKPNAWWIARYLPEETDNETKLDKANEILGNAREFLKGSASKHAITRTVMRYGPKRIAAFLGILAMLSLTSFAVIKYYNKQNESVLNSIHQQTLNLYDNPKVTLSNKVTLICEEMKLGRTTPIETVSKISDKLQQVNIANGIATLLIFQGMGQPAKEISESLAIADSLLESTVFPEKNPDSLSKYLKEMNDLRATLELGYLYNPDTLFDQWRKRNARREAKWALKILEQQPSGFQDMQELGEAMENALNYRALTTEEITKLIGILSPIDNPSPSAWLQSNYQEDKMMARGEENYGFKFNGLYQELAYLYAAAGNPDKTLQCMDTLFKYSQNNFQGEYSNGADNASNIAAVFFSNGTTDQLDAFVQGYCSRKKISGEEFYSRLIARCLRERGTAAVLDLYWWMNAKLNLNLRFSSRVQLSYFCNKYRELVQSTIKDADQKNFLMALSFKNEGILKSINHEQPAKGELTVKEDFDQAVLWYGKVNTAYLAVPVSMSLSSADEQVAPRRDQFIFPDYITAFHPFEPRSFFYFYFSDVFMEYILDNGLFDKFYPRQDELKNVSNWMNDINVTSFFPVAFLRQNVRYELFQKLALALEKNNNSANLDFNLLFLNLGLFAQQSGDLENMVNYYRKVQPNMLLNILRNKEYGGNVNHLSFRLIAYAVKGLTQSGHFDEAHNLVSVFKNPTNRSSLYAFAASEMLQEKPDKAMIQQLIDSARNELARTQNVTGGQPNREVLAHALALQSPSANMDEINKLIKNLPEKTFAFQHTARSYAFQHELFEARDHIPRLISDDDQANFLWNILYGYSQTAIKPGAEWETFQKYYRPFFVHRIEYVDESN